MRSASPVWYAMLDPESRFSTITNATYQLEDDNLEALFIILLACHHKCHLVPQSITFYTLHAICVTADKYDCIGELWPWISKWVEQVDKVTILYGPEWPLIAWVVGDMELFKTVTGRLVSACATNDSDQCLSRSGEVLDDLLLPDLPSKYISSAFPLSPMFPLRF